MRARPVRFVPRTRACSAAATSATSTVVPAGRADDADRERPRRRAPAVAQTCFPSRRRSSRSCSRSCSCARCSARPAGQKAFWAAGFLLFGVGGGGEATAQRRGWTPGLFRAYYLCGGVLTVAYLGAGSAWLQAPAARPRPAARRPLVATVAAAVTVAARARWTPRLWRATASGRPPANGALGGHAFLWAVALNTFGTLWLVGGSLWSIPRRQRVRANLWIAGGALVVAAATGLSRAGAYSLRLRRRARRDRAHVLPASPSHHSHPRPAGSRSHPAAQPAPTAQ